MSNYISITSTHPAGTPIPIALYETNGIVFELYRGGRCYQPFGPISWEQLKTFEISGQGDLTFHVRVSHAHYGNATE